MSAFGKILGRLLLAGLRPGQAAAANLEQLHPRLLSDLQRIIDLDAETPAGALELGVSKDGRAVQEKRCRGVIGGRA